MKCPPAMNVKMEVQCTTDLLRNHGHLSEGGTMYGLITMSNMAVALLRLLEKQPYSTAQ